MNSIKPEQQANNSDYLKPILIRKDNGDGKNDSNQPKKRVTFKQCVSIYRIYRILKWMTRIW